MKVRNPIDRRRFIAGSLVAATALPTARAADPGTRIKAGFLGTAYSHFRDKFALLRQSTDFELVGLCEEDDEVRARGPKDARWLTREELFAAAEVIVVESAVQDHARHAKLALEAGRHVHLEKPPADTLPAFLELLDVAEAKRRVLQIGYMWRYNPGIQSALEAARQGWLGRVFLVRATMNTLLGAEERRNWAQFPGGAMFEQGCHLIDPLVRLLGRPLKVTPFLNRSGLHPDDLADNTIAVMEFEQAMGLVTCAPLQPNAGAHRFFEILGTQGTARVQPLEPPGLILDLARPAGPYSSGRQEIALPAYRRYVDEFRDLAAAIRGEKALPVSPAEERVVQESLLRATRML